MRQAPSPGIDAARLPDDYPGVSIGGMVALHPAHPPSLGRVARFLGLPVLIVAALLPAQVLADTEAADWSVRGWRSDSGLPYDQDYDLTQSTDGYLWVATAGGVFRFDGTRFEAIPVPQLSRRSSDFFYVLCAARDGSVWWALDHGRIVRWWQGHTSVWQMAQGMPDDVAISICEGRNGAMFIGFRKSGVVEIAGGKVTQFSPATGIPRQGHCCLAADADGNVWCAANDSLLAFQNGTFVPVADIPGIFADELQLARNGGFWLRNTHGVRHLVPGKGIDQTIQVPGALGRSYAFHEDKNGSLWIGTVQSPQSGLFLFENGKFVPVSMEHSQVTSITSDHEGNIWLTTYDDGIKQLRPRLIQFLNVNPGLSWGRVSSFVRDAAGELWVVLEDSTVFCRTGDQWIQIPQFSRKGGAFGRALMVEAAPDGSVLIGTWANGLFRCAGPQATPVAVPTDPQMSRISAMLYSHTGDFWIAAHTVVARIRGGVLAKWTNPDGASANLLAEGANGDMLMATEGGDTDKGRLYRVAGGKIAQIPFPGAQDFPIRSLWCDGSGTIWMGFVGGGLGRLQDGHFVRATMADGLADDYIYQLLPDGLGRIWITSNTGLSRVDVADFDRFAGGQAKRLRVVTFAQEENDMETQASVRTMGFNNTVGHCCRVIGDELWFSYGDGILIVSPKARAPNNIPPPVAIESLRVDGRDISLEPSSSAALTLPPTHSRIEFDYAALSFDSPDNNQYRYMLEGYDKQWNEAGTVQQATYTRLTAGDYRFRVIACNSDGVWNEVGAGVSFTVAPFYWQTWWFRVAVLAASILCVVVIVRFVSYRRLRWKLLLAEQEAALHKEKARIARDIHDQLGSSLTQIAITSKLAKMDPPDAVVGHINEIAGIARRTAESVDEIVWAVNPRNDTLSSLLEYLGQHALDFLASAGIACEAEIPGKLPAIPLAAHMRHHLFLAVKESLTNVVKHAEASVVWLTVELPEGGLRVIVADNGRGFEAGREHAGADGLRNMRHRMGELEGECRISSNLGHGTRVIFEVPLTRNGARV